MEVIRLNSTHRADALIEGWSSMIWTERYVEPGEFELKTPLVRETRALLPEDTYLSIRDSKEVMLVETHQIGRDENDIDILTIKGRTFDSFLENRVKTPVTGGDTVDTPWAMKQNYTAAQAAAVLVWNSVANFTETYALGPGAQVLQNIPNVRVSINAVTSDPAIQWWLEMGEVHQTVMDFLIRGGLGIRNRRPETVSSYMDVNTDGTLFTSFVWFQDHMLVDIYNGLDRTKEQSTNPRVIFHHQTGDLAGSEYLFSNKGFKNNIRHVSNLLSAEYVENSPAYVALPQIKKRHMIKFFGKHPTDVPPGPFQNKQYQDAAIEIKKHPRTKVFSGEIQPTSKYRYGIEYGLGDKVSLIGDYGLSETMIVSEHTRTHDQDGERGYPGLMIAP